MRTAIRASRLIADGARLSADGTRLLADGTRLLADSTRLLADSTRLLADGARLLADGARLQHIELDETVHLDRVLHRKLLDDGLDETGHDHRGGLVLGKTA